MRTKPIAALLLALLFAACTDGAEPDAQPCEETRSDHGLSGEVRFEGYEGGVIELAFVEERSCSCSATEVLQSRTPGQVLATLILDEPGPFTLSLSQVSTNLTAPSSLLITARNRPDADEAQCQGAGTLDLSPGDHADVVLEMKPGPCPKRM